MQNALSVVPASDAFWRSMLLSVVATPDASPQSIDPAGCMPVGLNQNQISITRSEREFARRYDLQSAAAWLQRVPLRPVFISCATD